MAKKPFDTLIKSLARREHSRAELSRKLKTLHADLSVLERANLLDRLLELNYQSDQRFAEMLIRSRLARGQGSLRIQQELSTHSIDGAEFKYCFDNADESEYDRCRRALTKWVRVKKDPTREKALLFLKSRGFNFSDATEAVKAIFR